MAELLIQVLLTIDPDTTAGKRDIAFLLVGWYGAFRRSELAGIRRHHLRPLEQGMAVALPRSKAWLNIRTDELLDMNTHLLGDKGNHFRRGRLHTFRDKPHRPQRPDH